MNILSGSLRYNLQIGRRILLSRFTANKKKNTTERGYKLLSIYLGIVTALIIAGIIASSVIFLISTTR